MRRRLAKKVAAGELTLAKLRAITGGDAEEGDEPVSTRRRRAVAPRPGRWPPARHADDALMDTKGKLAGCGRRAR